MTAFGGFTRSMPPAPTLAQAVAFRGLLNRFIQVCHTIDYAHDRGVLHRDIKPSNVMLGPYGETLVVDWGVAKVLGDRSDGTDDPTGRASPHLTAPGSAIGTPAFMAPEQFSGQQRESGPASDVYSLGATLYCILTGEVPFVGDDLAAIDVRVRRGDFPRPHELRRDVPPALEAVCLKAMALKPENRYLAAGPMAADVEKWLADEPVTVWREPVAARTRRWMRRHRSWVAASAAALTITSIVAAAAALSIARSLTSERAARSEAQANFVLARATVDDFLTQVSESRELKRTLPGLQKFRTALLNKALAYYKGFLAQHATDLNIREEVASAYLRAGSAAREIGKTDEARDAFERAVAIFNHVARNTAQDRRLNLLCAAHTTTWGSCTTSPATPLSASTICKSP